MADLCGKAGIRGLKFALWAASIVLAAAGCGIEDNGVDTAFAEREFPPFDDSALRKIREEAVENGETIRLIKVYLGDRGSALLSYARKLDNRGFNCDTNYRDRGSGMYGYKCLSAYSRSEFAWLGVNDISSGEARAIWIKAKSGHYLYNFADDAE